MNYQYITKQEDVGQHVERMENYPIKYIDTETTGLDPYTSKIRLLQIYTEGNPVLIFDLFRIKDLSLFIKFFINENKKHHLYVGHHLKFDSKFFLYNLKNTPEHVYCTMLADQVLYAGKNGYRYRLKDLSERYLNKSIDKKCQSEGWYYPILSEEQLKYASTDVLILKRIRDIQQRLLEKENLLEVAMLEFQCIEPIASMELQGILVDAKKLLELHQFLSKEKTRLEQQLKSIFGSINIYSPQQIKSAFEKHNIYVESTNKITLLPLCEEFEPIKWLLQCRSARKKIQKIEELNSLIHKKTQRIHTNFYQLSDGNHGASTGRISSADPNMQNIPSFYKFRKCFVSSDGNLLFCGDYSQIEVRTMAKIANDEALQRTFLNGKDVYKMVAASPFLLNKSIDGVTKAERTKIKEAVLGLLFGMGVSKLKETLMGKHQIKISKQEALNILNGLLTEWDGVKNYHNTVKSQRPKVTRTIMGRCKHFPSFNYNEIINAPIQGTAADIIKKAIVALYQKLKQSSAKILLSVHDEILLEASEKDKEDILYLQKTIMEQVGEELLSPVPVIVNCSYGSSWDDKK